MARKKLIKLDAAVFQMQPGDPVKAGEVLGQSGGEAVLALSAGLIEAVSFDPDDHSLLVLICEENNDQ